LAGLLSQLTGNLTHHVKISFQFIQILESVRLQPDDLMVSFDMMSLFTKVPITDTIELLSHHFGDDVLALFKHVLASTDFCFEGQFYEHHGLLERTSTLTHEHSLQMFLYRML
jgi:hypothetical protein